MPLSRPLTGLLLATALTVGSSLSWAQASPFQRAQGAGTTSPAAANPGAPTDFAYTGVVAIGDAPMLCITVVSTQRSHWIKEGQTVAGITVLSYDPEAKTVQIRQAGRELTLSMKARSYDPTQLQAYQPTAVSPVAQAGIAETIALTNEEKATEARMLVSDLLEIGIIQRKAYEKAKQDQAEEQKKASQTALDSNN